MRTGATTATSPLVALWAARSIAVIGASDRPGSLGRLPVEFLQRYGYAGRIHPVRPDGQPVCGLPSWPSVTSCDDQVDLAMIMVSAPRVPDAVADCVAAGVQVAVVCTSGFAETGADGAALQDRVAAMAKAGGLRLVGPNCIGSVGVGTGQVTSFSPLFSGSHTELVPGRIGFVSQSGALGYGAVSLAFERGLGLGWVVNTGNEADVSATEVIAAMAATEGCDGILAYTEALTDLPSLRAATGRGVPVAMLKAGRSKAGAEAAASHTGALAAEDKVVDAALRQLGIVRVDDVTELLDVGDVMALPRPAGRRVAVVTTSGGSGILAADGIAAENLSLADLSPATTRALEQIVPSYGSTANPVDVTAAVMSNSELFDRTLDVISDDPGVDAILATFCVLTGKDVDDVVTSLARVTENSGKPVLAVRTGADHLAPEATARMRAAGIPSYPTPARAVRALAALTRFGEHARLRETAVPPPTPSGPAALQPRAGATEQEMKHLLSEHGIPVPVGRRADSPEDAVAAAVECGGRAVLKAVVPGLVHKSDSGGVVLGVTPAEAAAAYDKVASLGGDVWVEEMVDSGVEALVGFTSTPLGTVLTVGLGGVLTELVGDVSLRVLPVTRAEIEEMVDETRLGRLLAGMRGAPPADRAAFVGCVVRLADLVRSWPAGFELDLNPVTVLPQGVRVLDAAYVAPTPHPDHRPAPPRPH